MDDKGWLCRDEAMLREIMRHKGWVKFVFLAGILGCDALLMVFAFHPITIEISRAGNASCQLFVSSDMMAWKRIVVIRPLVLGPNHNEVAQEFDSVHDYGLVQTSWSHHEIIGSNVVYDSIHAIVLFFPFPVILLNIVGLVLILSLGVRHWRVRRMSQPWPIGFEVKGRKRDGLDI